MATVQFGNILDFQQLSTLRYVPLKFGCNCTICADVKEQIKRLNENMWICYLWTDFSLSPGFALSEANLVLAPFNPSGLVEIIFCHFILSCSSILTLISKSLLPDIFVLVVKDQSLLSVLQFIRGPQGEQAARCNDGGDDMFRQPC